VLRQSEQRVAIAVLREEAILDPADGAEMDHEVKADDRKRQDQDEAGQRPGLALSVPIGARVVTLLGQDFAHRLIVRGAAAFVNRFAKIVRVMAGSLFCFGLGYGAGFLARDLARQGWTIAGTSREGAAAPIALHRFDRAHPLADARALLAGTTHLLVSIPPDAIGCPVHDLHGADIAATAGLHWIGYLSSTNVYGDCAGGWVDEATPLAPGGERGRRRAAAEAAWLALGRSSAIPVQIFRLAAIYGPGRNALDALRAGTARRIVKQGQVFSRIHVADLAAVLAASMARPRPGAIYNVCDDEPAPPDEVIAYAAGLLNMVPPPLEDFATAALSPLARSFFDDSKRVSNRRIKNELGIGLRYPSYREGLRSLLGS
jgi:dTDP-4-dehydrorhamnose reductase